MTSTIPRRTAGAPVRRPCSRRPTPLAYSCRPLPMRSCNVCLLARLLAAGTGVAQGGTPAPLAVQEPVKSERPADAKALFATFARIPGLEAHYTEKKHLALLAAPLESKGRLYFLAPGYLARVVESPEKS